MKNIFLIYRRIIKNIKKKIRMGCKNKKRLYFCNPNSGRKRQRGMGRKGKFFERMEWCSKWLKSINLRTQAIKSGQTQSKRNYIGWRVWSWLRMNAGGRLNTCKSNGNSTSNSSWRVAHGCVTRMQPTHNRNKTLRNWR